MNSYKIEYIIDKIKTSCGNGDEVTSRIFEIGNKKIAYLYLESVASDDKISNFINKSISKDAREIKKMTTDKLFLYLQNTIPSSKMRIINNFDEIFYFLASGFTCLFVDDYQHFLIFETKATLDRGVQTSDSEPTVKGPKDAFTENHMINIGLLRKRIKDNNLWFDTIKIGRRTKTKVSIAYIKDIVDTNKVKKIKKKLEQIDIDGIKSSSSLRDILIGKQNMSFPKMINTERPDVACTSLLNGKIVLLLENCPMSVIIPGTLTDFLKSADDEYQKPLNASFTRILRLLAFIITVSVPALYIAIMAFNHEAIPEKLLISLASQREDVPFPTVFEVIMLTTVFEILRECDIRVPNTMGTSISIVGALVLGEAAVNASLVSPIVVIIVAITDICSLLFTDVDFINATRIWRLIFIIFASFLGLVGVVIIGLIFIIKLASLESLGTPYLAPFSPFYLKSQKNAILKFANDQIEERPEFLNIKDKTRLGGKK